MALAALEFEGMQFRGMKNQAEAVDPLA
jgi:hypothetical protein